ncbi:MAG: hypothetical protein ACFFAH_01655 [Promethearchaeota archaeon]
MELCNSKTFKLSEIIILANPAPCGDITIPAELNNSTYSSKLKYLCG